MSDEALFHCSGFMNAQNTHHWDAKSHHQLGVLNIYKP
jgi:hypothetical protein